MDRDTIAAIATPAGRGGVGIVRVSGPSLSEIVQGVIGRPLTSRHAHFTRFLDADRTVIDEGIALFFPAPASFTGEDVLELQAHGGPVVMDLLLRRVLGLGARPARPGEFSERAFLNGKIDLAQAEAIADLIDSQTEVAARLASRSLKGDLSRRVHRLVEDLTRLRVYIEAALDFPDEEIDFLSDGKVSADLRAIAHQLVQIKAGAQLGRLVRDGMTLVIAGRPNAGKSSLMNALAGEDRAIVTEVPGTTRDLLREEVQIDGLPVHLIDTAGLRQSDDPVEREGIRRARAEIAKADLVLWVADDQSHHAWEVSDLPPLPGNVPILRVLNKIDLTGRPSGPVEGSADAQTALSAKTGRGLDYLRLFIKDLMGYQAPTEGAFMARRRHLDALERADSLVARGVEAFQETGSAELLAEDLRGAQNALSEITGTFSSEDLLGRIFSSFCIGK
jgi:tRNA modification GTPase